MKSKYSMKKFEIVQKQQSQSNGQLSVFPEPSLFIPNSSSVYTFSPSSVLRIPF